MIICGKHAEWPRCFWLPKIRITPMSWGIDWLYWGVAWIGYHR